MASEETGIPTTETTPLVSGRRASITRYSTQEDQPIASLEEGLKAPEEDATTWNEEAKLLARYSWPLILTYGLQYSFPLVVILAVGRLGTEELGAISLVYMTANITGMAVYEGLSTSLDTLCAQAYGSGRKQLVGLHLQRMIIFLWLISIPILCLWFSAHWFLPYLVPEREVALLAAKGLRYYMIGAPGYATFEAAKRFTQAQGIFSASFYVLLICAPINALLVYLMVFRFDLGFTGAILSISISNNLLPILLFGYITLINPAALQCWPGINFSLIFRNWKPMLRLSLPGVLMVLSEWLAFDILTFASALLSSSHLAAQSVIQTVCVIIYHIPFPISIAASTRIGNLIGSSAIRSTTVAVRTYTVIFLLIGLLDLVLMILLRTTLPRIFTTDPRVIELVASVMPIVAAFQLFDSTAALANGILRGLGRQFIGGWANLTAYYVFAVPVALVLAFVVKWDLVGLWIGPLVGLGMLSLFEGIYIVGCDWRKAAEDAKGRGD